MNSRKKVKDINVLSFDGGGSKGVMEAIILEDIMNTATLLVKEPKTIQPWITSKSFFETTEERQTFSNLLSNVQDPIKPHGKINFKKNLHD